MHDGLPKSQWAALIPHQGSMCLLDSVAHWDDVRIHARSGSHARDDNPLRRDGRLRALHLCEYGAQAMAVHGGLLAQAAAPRRGCWFRCARCGCRASTSTTCPASSTCMRNGCWPRWTAGSTPSASNTAANCSHRGALR